jgi:hypothetical protein
MTFVTARVTSSARSTFQHIDHFVRDALHAQRLFTTKTRASHKPINKFYNTSKVNYSTSSSPYLRQRLDLQLLLCIHAAVQGFRHPLSRQQPWIWISHPVSFKQATPVNAAQLELWSS